MRCTWTALVVVALAGCGRRERDCEDRADNDEDGWTDCSDQDCAGACGELCANLLDDDGDGLVDCLDPQCDGSCPGGPGGIEDCANGVDDDGDWLVDCGDDGCDPLCDSDGDGWVDLEYGGDDCDDQEPSVHPTAEEVPYDGLDGDCDPLTPDDDVDGDGFLLAADCADDDPLTYPGAPETCGDAALNDCDNSVAPPRSDCFGERSASTADASAVGPSTDEKAGYSVSGAGDLDGDGYDDFIVGAYGSGDQNTGAAYVVKGPIEGELDLAEADVKWVGEGEDDWAGFAVAGGADLTGDGYPDMIIGARYDDEVGNNGGAAYVIRGGGQGTVELFGDAPWSKLIGEMQYDNAGFAVGVVGDVNGDTFADLIVGSPLSSRNGNGAGIVHVVLGPVPEDRVQLYADVQYRLVGEQIGDNAGCAVNGAGDLDGDGLDDLVVGACLSDRSGNDGGAAFQFSTHELVDRLVSDADGAMVAEAPGDHLGASLAGGDLDNDGLSDLVIGAPARDGVSGADEGAAYVALGPATTAMNMPDAKLTGASAGELAGTSVAVLDDLDGDGFREIVVGAPGSDRAAEDAGAAYVVFGPVFGLTELAGADVQLTGAGAFDFLGQSVAAAGDVDADGWPDLLVGAPYHDGLAPSGGATHLFTFGW